MSSMTRRLQRAFKRQKNYRGRGKSLGFPVKQTNPDLAARLRREAKREAERNEAK